ncbi:MAG: hypothetical protein JKY48_15290 [Flavobacteriales bacterium]|nr:hypothetical protein [Flavobacteriales bacterium]
MNIGILCNSKLCIPSVQALVQMGHKVSMGLPVEVTEDRHEIEQFAYQFSISLTKLKKEGLDSDLIFWKERNSLENIFVITFPYILSANLIASIRIDIINFHFAPLPQYKGAQPAFWLIKNGEKSGGLTIHLITEKIDGGDIIHFEPYTLADTETYHSYLNNVAFLNANIIQKLMNKIALKSWKNSLKKQDTSLSVYYPRPQLNDIRINWETMEAEEIERLCRACNPWNKGAIAVLYQQAIKLVEVNVLPFSAKQEPAGTLVRIKNTNRLAVSCINNKYLDINIAYNEQLGFYSNSRLSQMGLKEGMSLE